MNNTAGRADWPNYEKDANSYIKVRVMSTPNQIDAFHKLLNRCEELGMCEVINFSRIFHNRNTEKYYRAYSEIEIGGQDNE